jgi:Transposase zinc-binding domain
MSNNQRLKRILVSTRNQWDRPEIRPAVRENFDKVINCRTSALGAEVFASEAEEKVVYHTCKSRSCPSCGQRATLLWQREQWNALPDIPYSGMGFTMPSELWPIFRRNRQLLHDLPALAAAVIQQWVKMKYGVRVLIVVVPHTFGRHLNFNAHLHVMV